MNRIKTFLLFKESIDMSIFDWMKRPTCSYNSGGVSTLIGETLVKIDIDKTNNIIYFYTKSGRLFKMDHEEECTESVTIDDIEGDTNDLVGYPLTVAEESTNSDDLMGKDSEYGIDSFTWTFYRFATIKGWLIVRWFGESNGYYSESVDFYEIMVNNLAQFRDILLKDIKNNRIEMEERISEFNVIREGKIDIISLEQLYQFYDKEFNLDKFKSIRIDLI